LKYFPFSAFALSSTMAALAVHGALPLFSRPLLTRPLLARPLLSTLFSTPFSTPFIFAAVPAFLAASRTWAFPSLQSLLELFPPFVLAVPKKKVSHSRKSMREANKGLKDKKSLLCAFYITLTLMHRRYC
jgi:large subunit ribosomal protein L32